MWSRVILAIFLVVSYTVAEKPQTTSQKVCKAFKFTNDFVAEKIEKVNNFKNEWFTHSYLFKKVNLSDAAIAWFNTLKAIPLAKTRPLVYNSYSPLRAKRGTEHITSPIRVRKEYRQLTNSERTSFHNAVMALCNNVIGSTNSYDIFVTLHRYSMSPGAHIGAAFLPWHREFLLRFENALFQMGYTGPGLPYWDSTLDNTLPDASDAQIWTAGFLGNNDGNVNSGPFFPWSTIPGCGPTFKRDAMTGASGNAYLLKDADLNNVFSKTCFKDITYYTDRVFELAHGAVHVWLGGQMRSLNCAPTDPVFFMHHAFIDCIWETFRQDHQTSNRETEYPTSAYGSSYHKWDANMKPFDGLLNAHGISDHYTNYYYQCKNRLKFCSTHASCGNTATMWCDMTHCTCRPKVRQGGDCTGLPDIACSGCPRFHNIKCESNRCICKSISITASYEHMQRPAVAFRSGKK